MILKYQNPSGPIILKDPINHEAVESNKRNRRIAKGLWNGMWSGQVIPSMGNITKMIGAAYSGYLDPEKENNMSNTGEAPNPGMRNPTNIVKGVQTAATVAKKAPSIIQSYFEVVPRFINKVKNFNGADKVGRTISAATKLINPNYTKTLAKSPELVDHINLYNFKEFNTKQLQDFQKVWSSEASKAPFSLDGMLKFDTTPDKIKDLPKHFEEARKIQKGIDLGKRYGRVISRKYQQMYDQITDPTLRHVADTSPQYIPELFQQQKQFGGATEEFMKSLIKRSNSYRRFMTRPNSAEDFATFKGSGLVQDGNKSARQINVEGHMRSDFNGEYGSYPGYYEGQPQLKGDMSTWWDQRVPQGVDVKEGIWSENPTINKFRTRFHEKYSDNGISAAEKAFWENYSAPRKFIDWPTHQVFFGPEGSQLPGFKVTTEMPKGFTFGKGYKQGGKL